MKGRVLILIFLFLIILIPASASTTETFSRSGAMSFDATPPASGPSGSELTHGYGWLVFKNIENFQGLSYVYMIVPQAQWKGTKVAESTSTSLAISSVTVGTGTYQYNQLSNGDYRLVLIINDDWDVSAYSGLVDVEIVDDANIEAGYSVNAEMYSNYHNIQPADTVTFTSTYLANPNPKKTLDATHTGYTEYDFINSYTYYKDGIIPYISVEKYTSPSDWTVETENSVEIHGDTSTNMVDFIASGTPENNTFYLSVTDNYGNLYSDTISFSGMSYGWIEFNQSHYTDPKNIEVEWNIDGFNTETNNYEIQVITSISGDPSQDSWPADGNWNTSPFISSASGAAVFDFYSDGYDLPIWIQGELWAQDKNTGTWTELDSTPAVVYHESTGGGNASISLNATYDVGDLALVTWQAADEDADIIIQFTNLNTSYIHTMEPYIWISGIQKFEVYFTNEYIGKIKVKLIENGVTTAVVYTMVSSPSTPYIEWYNSEIPLGTDAYYSYYTDNSSDTIAIYGPNLDLDPPVFNELFNLFSAETGHHYLHTTTAGKDAGEWTISLLHDGTTYYNDTMMVTTADAFVRFDGDEFEIGDTIEITYQLSESTEEIWMFDANNKVVVQFTCQWGALSMGGVRTVDYSLVDNNEYGHDIESLISAGHYETGTWKIYIVRNGILSSESDEWDITTIKSATSDPGDTSNEMISIFFSLEGIFLIFTAVLTVLGLAVTKHPGGGAACAVVGVGFGVFFKVLPVWMLLLMIITLVVLAGVSVAVYFRGK